MLQRLQGWTTKASSWSGRGRGRGLQPHDVELLADRHPKPPLADRQSNPPPRRPSDAARQQRQQVIAEQGRTEQQAIMREFSEIVRAEQQVMRDHTERVGARQLSIVIGLLERLNVLSERMIILTDVVRNLAENVAGLDAAVAQLTALEGS